MIPALMPGTIIAPALAGTKVEVADADAEPVAGVVALVTVVTLPVGPTGVAVADLDTVVAGTVLLLIGLEVVTGPVVVEAEVVELEEAVVVEAEMVELEEAVEVADAEELAVLEVPGTGKVPLRLPEPP